MDTNENSPTTSTRGVRGALAAAVALLVVFGILIYFGHRGRDENPLRFAALGNQVITAPAIVAVREKRFETHGVDVVSFDVTAGAFALEAVVQGHADVAIVANAPLAIAAAQGAPPLVLGRIMFSDKIHAVIFHRSSDPFAGPIGFVPGTSSEFFLRTVLRSKGRSTELSEYNLVQLRPPGILPAFSSGSIKSAVIWEPFVSEIARQKTPPFEATPDLEVDRYPGLYKFQMYLIASKSAWKGKRAQVLNFVRAMRDACAEVTKSPEETKVKMEAILSYQPGWLSTYWSDIDFSFSLDDATLRDPIKQDAVLSFEAHLSTSIPNIDPLFEALPEVRQQIDK